MVVCSYITDELKYSWIGGTGNLFQNNYNKVYFEVTNLMSSFDNKSLKKDSLWSTYTPACYVPHSVKVNNYFNIPSTINVNTSDNLRSTTS